MPGFELRPIHVCLDALSEDGENFGQVSSNHVNLLQNKINYVKFMQRKKHREKYIGSERYPVLIHVNDTAQTRPDF